MSSAKDLIRSSALSTVTAENELAAYGSLLRRMSNDERLNATHVGLFSGLFVHWQCSGFVSPFAVTRRTVMAYSRIGSIVTYHKCMKELDEYGYIRYQPSYHPKKGSLVYWIFGH
jgi:hypothetical protein